MVAIDEDVGDMLIYNILELPEWMEFDGVSSISGIPNNGDVGTHSILVSVTDEEVVALSRGIAQKIEAEMAYPGQIKVTVIRESRSVDYAR